MKMCSGNITILVYGDMLLFETINDLLSKLGFKTQYVISSKEYLVKIIKEDYSEKNTIDYAIILNSESIEEIYSYMEKAGLVITNNCIEDNNIVCIKDNDKTYVASILFSLLGIPIDELMKIVDREHRRIVLKAYTYLMYRVINNEVKRLV